MSSSRPGRVARILASFFFLSTIGLGAALIWSWTWGSTFAVAGVASLAAVPFVVPENRVDWYTSAASAAVGVAPFVLAPLDVIEDAKDLHARLATDVHDDQVCALLADAEAKLVRDAENEAFGRGWWMHAGNVAFNTGIFLFLGLASGMIELLRELNKDDGSN